MFFQIFLSRKMQEPKIFKNVETIIESIWIMVDNYTSHFEEPFCFITQSILIGAGHLKLRTAWLVAVASNHDCYPESSISSNPPCLTFVRFKGDSDRDLCLFCMPSQLLLIHLFPKFMPNFGHSQGWLWIQFKRTRGCILKKYFKLPSSSSYFKICWKWW